jgi:hypothetical protein
MFRTLLVMCGLLLFSGIAQARPHHYRHHIHHQSIAPVSFWGFEQQRPTPRNTAGEGVIGGRPSGCPTQYCGCGASLYLFGRIIPALNLAAAWYKFPPAAPTTHMVGVRAHHIVVLEQQVSGNQWLVHDSNSGGHLTRRHVIDISRYSIRNPSGGSHFASM